MTGEAIAVQRYFSAAKNAEELFLLACLMECYASDALTNANLISGVVGVDDLQASIDMLRSTIVELVATGGSRPDLSRAIGLLAARLDQELRGGVRFANRAEVLEGCQVDLFSYGEHVRSLASLWPMPMAIVGIRSSGSVLAPIAAASLGRESYSTIRSLPLRLNYFEPRASVSARAPRTDARELSMLSLAGARTVLILDDLVGSGATTATAVERIRAVCPCADIVVAVLCQTRRATVQRILQGAAPGAEVHLLPSGIIRPARAAAAGWERLGPSSYHRALRSRSGISAGRLHVMDRSPHAYRYRSSGADGGRYHRYVGAVPSPLRAAIGLAGECSTAATFTSARWIEGHPLAGTTAEAIRHAPALTDALTARWRRFAGGTPISDARRFITTPRLRLARDLSSCGALPHVPERLIHAPAPEVERFFFPDNVAPWHFLARESGKVDHVSGVVRHDARFVDPVGEAAAFALALDPPSDLLEDWLHRASHLTRDDFACGRVLDATLEALWFAICRARYFDARGEWLSAIANQHRNTPHGASVMTQEPTVAQTVARCHAVASAVLAILS